MPTTVHIIRHGETIANKVQRFQGQCDEPFAQLNDLGKEQAKLAGEAIHHEKISFDAAFASDLGRASETARIIVANSQTPKSCLLETDSRLRERAMGSYEGMFIKDCPRPLSFDVMEDDISMRKRVLAFWRDCIETLSFDGDEIKDRHVLVVCHGGSSQHLVHGLLQDEAYVRGFDGTVRGGKMLGNCERARVVMSTDRGGAVVGIGEKLTGSVNLTDGDDEKGQRLDDTSIR